MTTAWLGAWACVASGVMALGWSVRPEHDAAIPDIVQRGAVSVARRASSPPLIGDVATRDLFRASRRAATIAYDPQSAVAAPSPAVPKPVLTLVGLVACDDPSAVIEGFPGVEGSRVVRVGDVVARLTVRRIAEGEVRIAGMDTLWVLTMKLWE